MSELTLKNKENPIVMDRRQLLSGLAAGTVLAFAGGCATNPVTGRRQLMLVSDAQLAEMASASWTQLLRQERVSRNATQNRQVYAVGDRIVRASGLTGQNWEYAVFDNPQVNAFVMPGGKVGFYSGILDIMQNDSQIATVMGHEVGHVAGRHAAERYSQQMAAGVITTATAVALEAGDVEGGAAIAGILGAGVSFGVILPYSRSHEYEADELGVRYMDAARYDPRQALTFWNQMAARSRGSRPLEFMSTHPSDANRIQRMQGVISTLA